MGKRFCRLFQTGMKGAMYLLPWSMPKLLEGPGKIKELPALIKSKGYDKVLLVTDKTLLQLHLADSLLAALDAAQVEYVLYDGVSPNPTDVQVEEGVAIRRAARRELAHSFENLHMVVTVGRIAVQIAPLLHQLCGSAQRDTRLQPVRERRLVIVEKFGEGQLSAPDILPGAVVHIAEAADQPAFRRMRYRPCQFPGLRIIHRGVCLQRR